MGLLSKKRFTEAYSTGEYRLDAWALCILFALGFGLTFGIAAAIGWRLVMYII